jgi:hypothetical protein
MKALISLSAAAALVASAALAEDQPMRNPHDQPMKPTQAQFESLDRNHDQQLSKAEANADNSIAAQFGSLDANADGYVSKSEYMAHSDHSMKQPDEPQSSDRGPPPGRD